MVFVLVKTIGFQQITFDKGQLNAKKNTKLSQIFHLFSRFLFYLIILLLFFALSPLAEIFFCSRKKNISLDYPIGLVSIKFTRHGAICHFSGPYLGVSEDKSLTFSQFSHRHRSTRLLLVFSFFPLGTHIKSNCFTSFFSIFLSHSIQFFFHYGEDSCIAYTHVHSHKLAD